MVYGSETWAMTVEIRHRLQRTEKQMVRWMCDVSVRDRVPSEKLRERMGIGLVSDVIRRNRLRWPGHLLRKDDGWWMVQGDVEGRG